MTFEKKTLLKTSKKFLIYSNSLGRHFSSMFHAKCLLPRLDWLLPLRSCLQNFYQCMYLGECNIQWKGSKVCKSSTKRIWCSTDLEVGVLRIRLPQLTYFIVGLPNTFHSKNMWICPVIKLSRFLPSLPRVEILKFLFVDSFWNCLTFSHLLGRNRVFRVSATVL